MQIAAYLQSDSSTSNISIDSDNDQIGIAEGAIPNTIFLQSPLSGTCAMNFETAYLQSDSSTYNYPIDDLKLYIPVGDAKYFHSDSA